ncbi:MAG: hypothetical protein JWP85_1364 [Rhodoglobus sp.]|nr:hypothetical protein [Rhodoglobus sp.]
MELIPDRAHYVPGASVRVEFDSAIDADAALIVTRLQREVLTLSVPAGSRSVDLGTFEPGGYGVRLGVAATAFDVSDSPFDRPRYGFIARLTDDVDVQAVTRNFRRLHLNLAQLYDWAYRHSTLMPPTESYLDPLGMQRTLSAVQRMAGALSSSGTVPLGYSAVYAIGHDEVADWEGSILLRSDGERYRLGDDFLVLVDPAEPKWLEHYLGELERVVRETAIEGFHLDQYGWPKFAHRSDGAFVDLAASFVTLLEAVRDRLPEARFMFNNVNDFPTWATATTRQDATYVEVWDPHSELQDLAALAAAARALRPEHPLILSAYLPCYDGDESRANNAAALVMATAFSNGASHLLVGEDGNALTGPYYPVNHRLSPASIDFFVPWYDFPVRYGDLFYDPAQVDVTESFTGGINGDIVFSGAAFSTKAEAGTVWTRVVRTTAGLVVHLIDLTAQTETVWHAGKSDPGTLAGIATEVAPIGAGATVYFASVGAPDLVPLRVSGSSASSHADALTASQSSVSFELPEFRAWAFLLIPWSEFS